MLPFFLTLALDAAQIVAPPAGTYRYEAFVEGKTAGKASLTVTRTDKGIKIDERSGASLPTGDSSAHSSMVLDPATLAPLAYHASYTADAQNMDAVVTFGDRQASVVAGTDKRTFPLGGSSKSFIVLDSSMVSGFFMLPALMHVLSKADVTALVPGAATSIYLNIIPDDKPARPSDVPAGDASLSFAGEAPFVEWYDPRTLIVDQVGIPGQNLVVKRRP